MKDIRKALEQERAALQSSRERIDKALHILADEPASHKAPAKRGRPKAEKPKGKRTLSPEARARIVAAQKKRWAEKKAKA